LRPLQCLLPARQRSQPILASIPALPLRPLPSADQHTRPRAGIQNPNKYVVQLKWNATKKQKQPRQESRVGSAAAIIVGALLRVVPARGAQRISRVRSARPCSRETSEGRTVRPWPPPRRLSETARIAQVRPKPSPQRSRSSSSARICASAGDGPRGPAPCAKLASSRCPPLDSFAPKHCLECNSSECFRRIKLVDSGGEPEPCGRDFYFDLAVLQRSPGFPVEGAGEAVPGARAKDGPTRRVAPRTPAFFPRGRPLAEPLVSLPLARAPLASFPPAGRAGAQPRVPTGGRARRGRHLLASAQLQERHYFVSFGPSPWGRVSPTPGRGDRPSAFCAAPGSASAFVHLRDVGAGGGWPAAAGFSAPLAECATLPRAAPAPSCSPTPGDRPPLRGPARDAVCRRGPPREESPPPRSTGSIACFEAIRRGRPASRRDGEQLAAAALSP